MGASQGRKKKRASKREARRSQRQNRQPQDTSSRDDAAKLREVLARFGRSQLNDMKHMQHPRDLQALYAHPDYEYLIRHPHCHVALGDVLENYQQNLPEQARSSNRGDQSRGNQNSASPLPKKYQAEDERTRTRSNRPPDSVFSSGSNPFPEDRRSRALMVNVRKDGSPPARLFQLIHGGLNDESMSTPHSGREMLLSPALPGDTHTPRLEETKNTNTPQRSRPNGKKIAKALESKGEQDAQVSKTNQAVTVSTLKSRAKWPQKGARGSQSNDSLAGSQVTASNTESLSKSRGKDRKVDIPTSEHTSNKNSKLYKGTDLTVDVSKEESVRVAASHSGSMKINNGLGDHGAPEPIQLPYRDKNDSTKESSTQSSESKAKYDEASKLQDHLEENQSRSAAASPNNNKTNLSAPMNNMTIKTIFAPKICQDDGNWVNKRLCASTFNFLQ